MQHIIRTSWFLILLSFIWLGCKNNSHTYRPTTTIIEGQLTSSEVPIIVLSGDGEIKSTIDPSGKFFIQAELKNAGIYSLVVGDQRLHVFIVPGDRISLTADVRNLNHGAQFKGDHANENNYLVEYENLKLKTEPQDFQSFFGQKEEEFMTSVEKRNDEFVSDQQTYQKENGPFDELFAEMISEQIVYDAAIIKMNYPTYYEYLYPGSAIKLSDTYDSFLQNLEVDSKDNMMIPSYQNFLPVYLEFKTSTDTAHSELPLSVRKFNNISKKFQDGKVKEYLYYHLMKETLELSVNDAALCIDDFQKLETNVEFRNEINALYDQWKHLIKGKPAPSWEYLTPAGKNVSVDNLRGKVVYIDIWATWCGPCLRELPALEELQKSFAAQKDIEFVSISIDQDKNAWKTMVNQKKMKGIQLVADNAWSSKIVSDYKINGIPRFIILDKNGNIFNANAPRPSSKKEIEIELENALKESS
ncbi:MAG: TlpA family protein disulfide reductase [Saprospiraceae bacterium]|nr:TlpA family protein disulfide reductase [Saprospiraceae bacterium]